MRNARVLFSKIPEMASRRERRNRENTEENKEKIFAWIFPFRKKGDKREENLTEQKIYLEYSHTTYALLF